jgi:hypothetical protein
VRGKTGFCSANWCIYCVSPRYEEGAIKVVTGALTTSIGTFRSRDSNFDRRAWAWLMETILMIERMDATIAPRVTVYVFQGFYNWRRCHRHRSAHYALLHVLVLPSSPGNKVLPGRFGIDQAACASRRSHLRTCM